MSSTILLPRGTRSAFSALVSSKALKDGQAFIIKDEGRISVALGNENFSDLATKTEVDGKAPEVHQHAAKDITSGIINIARIPFVNGVANSAATLSANESGSVLTGSSLKVHKDAGVEFHYNNVLKFKVDQTGVLTDGIIPAERIQSGHITGMLSSDVIVSKTALAAFNGAIGLSGTPQFNIIQTTKDPDTTGDALPLRIIQFSTSAYLAEFSATGLSVTGSVNATGDITGLSDVRLKSDIQDISNATNIIGNLKGKKYIKNGKYEYGFIAQELENELPELVHESNVVDDEFKIKGERPTLSISSGNEINAILVEALKDTMSKLQIIESRLNCMEAKLS